MANEIAASLLDAQAAADGLAQYVHSEGVTVECEAATGTYGVLLTNAAANELLDKLQGL